MLRVLPRLYTHNSIRYNIDKGLSESSHSEEPSDDEAVRLVEEVNRDKSYKLNNPHEDNVGFAIGSSDRHIITHKSIENLNTPGYMNHTHVHGHLCWLQV